MNIKDKIGLIVELVESLQGDYEQLGQFDEQEELENMKWELIYQFEQDYA